MHRLSKLILFLNKIFGILLVLSFFLPAEIEASSASFALKPSLVPQPVNLFQQTDLVVYDERPLLTPSRTLKVSRILKGGRISQETILNLPVGEYISESAKLVKASNKDIILAYLKTNTQTGTTIELIRYKDDDFKSIINQASLTPARLGVPNFSSFTFTIDSVDNVYLAVTGPINAITVAAVPAANLNTILAIQQIPGQVYILSYSALQIKVRKPFQVDLSYVLNHYGGWEDVEVTTLSLDSGAKATTYIDGGYPSYYGLSPYFEINSLTGEAIVTVCTPTGMQFKYRDAAGNWGALTPFPAGIANANFVRFAFQPQGVLHGIVAFPFTSQGSQVDYVILTQNGATLVTQFPVRKLSVNEVFSGGEIAKYPLEAGYTLPFIMQTADVTQLTNVYTYLEFWSCATIKPLHAAAGIPNKEIIGNFTYTPYSKP